MKPEPSHEPALLYFRKLNVEGKPGAGEEFRFRAVQLRETSLNSCKPRYSLGSALHALGIDLLRKICPKLPLEVRGMIQEHLTKGILRFSRALPSEQ